MPFQFSNGEPSPNNQSVEKLEIQKGQIVLMESDGLWDNLPVNLIAHLLNYSLYLSLKGELTKDKIVDISKDIYLKYMQRLRANNKDVKRFAKSLYQTQKPAKS